MANAGRALFANGVETFLASNRIVWIVFPSRWAFQGKDTALIQTGGLQLVLGPTLLNHCLEPQVEDGRWRALCKFLAAPCHFHPEVVLDLALPQAPPMLLSRCLG